jgi:hypothetical protein
MYNADEILNFGKSDLEKLSISDLKEIEELLYNQYILVSKVKGYKELK